MRIQFLAAALAALSVTGANAALIGFYGFDETGGYIIHDLVGTADGITSGNAAFLPGGGLTGGALDLTTGGAGVMDDVFDFTRTNSDFSVQAWVKTTSTGGLIAASYHYAGLANGYFLALNDVNDGCGGTGTTHFYAGYPCTPGVTASFANGAWHQLVGTYTSSTGTRAFYYDGNLVGSNSAGAPGYVQARFMVGGIVVAGNAVGAFNGYIDNVGVWNHALDSGEVQSLYNSNGLYNATPEPGSLLLLLGGASALLISRRPR